MDVHPQVIIPPPFSPELWVFIDVFKTCHNIDPELIHAQNKLKKHRIRESSHSYQDKFFIIKILTEVKLLPIGHKGDIDFIKLIADTISNNYEILSKALVHRHVLKKRIHENHNKVLIHAIKSHKVDIISFLLNLPNVKATLHENENEVLTKAISFKSAYTVDRLLNESTVQFSAHLHSNRVLYSAIENQEESIIQKLMSLSLVRENLHQVFPKIYEFLKPEILAKVKGHIGLDHFHEAEIKDFALEASRVGHILGLSNKDRPNNLAFPINFEGTYDTKAMAWILEKINSFKNIVSDADFKKRMLIVSDTFQMSEYYRKKMFDHDFIEKDGHDSHLKLLEQYHQGRMVHVLAGWYHHKISIVLFRGYVAVSNRGEYGDAYKGTKIFLVKNPALLTSDWVRILMTTQDYKEAFSQLKKVIDLDDPCVCVPQAPQKYGTCCYVNKLASIEAMLLLLRANELGILVNREALKELYVCESRVEYKNMTFYFREHEIARLVQLIQERRYKDELLFDLVRAIIYQHPGNTNQVLSPLKFDIECARARRLISALPQAYQDKFKQMHLELYQLIQFDYFKQLSQGWTLVDYHRKRAQIKQDPYPLIPAEHKPSLKLTHV